jgi:hypothetical protein
VGRFCILQYCVSHLLLLSLFSVQSSILFPKSHLLTLNTACFLINALFCSLGGFPSPQKQRSLQLWPLYFSYKPFLRCYFFNSNYIFSITFLPFQQFSYELPSSTYAFKSSKPNKCQLWWTAKWSETICSNHASPISFTQVWFILKFTQISFILFIWKAIYWKKF